jgi:hypothetical protein
MLERNVGAHLPELNTNCYSLHGPFYLPQLCERIAVLLKVLSATGLENVVTASYNG